MTDGFENEIPGSRLGKASRAEAQLGSVLTWPKEVGEELSSLSSLSLGKCSAQINDSM